jgi:hypothetical protein
MLRFFEDLTSDTGHNEILRYTPVPLAVLRAFGMAEPESLSL